jgi:hypothetical protein
VDSFAETLSDKRFVRASVTMNLWKFCTASEYAVGLNSLRSSFLPLSYIAVFTVPGSMITAPRSHFRTSDKEAALRGVGQHGFGRTLTLSLAEPGAGSAGGKPTGPLTSTLFWHGRWRSCAFHWTSGGSQRNELCEHSFIKRAALVNPAVILGLNRVIVPGASVGLKPEGPVGFQHAPFGLVNGLAEGSTRDIGIQQLYKGHGATPSLLTNIHRAKEILHFEPPSQAYQGCGSASLISRFYLRGGPMLDG